MKKRIDGIIISIEFFLMLAIPIVLFNWTQGQKSVTENRNLTSFPSFFQEDGKLRNDILEQFDAWFKDNIGLRDPLINLSSVISYNIFNTSTSEKVELGKDGWLYYNAENNMNIVNNTYPNFTDDEIQIYCNQLIKVQERLGSQGREFIIVIPPSKVSIYPEYIQSGDYQIMETPADVFSDYLEKNSDIKVVRLKDVLLAEKNDSEGLLYFKTDTHWNVRGSYVGYRKIVEDMKEWNIIDSAPIEATFYSDGPYVGDLSGMLGGIDFKGNRVSEEAFDNISFLNSNAVELKSGSRYDGFIKLIESEGVEKPCRFWINDKKSNEPKILIYGDSMIGNCNANMIAENFSETAFVWSYLINQEMIDYFDPDIVMLDISERGLSTYLPGLFDNYLKTDFVFDEEHGVLDIYYDDNGELSQMYFPLWNESVKQEPVWYEAKRTSETEWHVQVRISDHGEGRYIIHFYDGPSGEGQFISETTYNMSSNQ